MKIGFLRLLSTVHSIKGKYVHWQRENEVGCRQTRTKVIKTINQSEGTYRDR